MRGAPRFVRLYLPRASSSPKKSNLTRASFCSKSLVSNEVCHPLPVRADLGLRGDGRRSIGSVWERFFVSPLNRNDCRLSKPQEVTVRHQV
jgi:hypothetical protein